MKIKHIAIVIALLAILSAAVSGLLIYAKASANGRISEGIYIGKVLVGGLAREEALNAISTLEAEQITSNPFYLSYDDGKKIIKYEFQPSQGGISIRAKECVDEAVSLSSGGNIIQSLIAVFVKKETVIVPKFEVSDAEQAKGLVEKISRSIDQKPMDARFVIELSKDKTKVKKYDVSIIPGRKGRTVKAGETLKELKKSVAEGKNESPLMVLEENPKVTTEMLERIPDPAVIASYTTYYGTHDSPNRIHNIYLVSSFVDNTYLDTGEVFSLIKPVGEFTRERGFREAYVIIGDELVPELGGGTCQIATTLYNTVMFADLEVLKRRCHGMYFSIYPLGRDAAVYPPHTDLKFRNNTGHPIVIQAIPFRKGLTFRIIGTPTGKTVTFTYPRLNYRVSTVTTYEPGSDEPVIKKVTGTAFSTSVVRTVKQNGKVIKKEKINSYYKLHGDKHKVKIRRKEPR